MWPLAQFIVGLHRSEPVMFTARTFFFLRSNLCWFMRASCVLVLCPTLWITYSHTWNRHRVVLFWSVKFPPMLRFLCIYCTGRGWKKNTPYYYYYYNNNRPLVNISSWRRQLFVSLKELNPESKTLTFSFMSTAKKDTEDSQSGQRVSDGAWMI